MIPYIETGSSMIFTWRDGTPRQVGKDHRNFEKISSLVKSVKSHEDLMYAEQELEELLTPAKVLKRIANTEGSELLLSDTYELSFLVDGKEVDIPLDLGEYILRLHGEGGNLEPMLHFLRKLSDNPDKRIADQIWGFIASCGLCLTPEGNFLAYKNVNKDFTSVWDSKTDNTPGTVLSMERRNVECNPDRTCSSGLHFAAWGYLAHYAPGRKTVLVSVSPADVVSIPTDYNNQKGRAYRYRIVREVAQPEELKNIVLFAEDGTDYD